MGNKSTMKVRNTISEDIWFNVFGAIQGDSIQDDDCGPTCKNFSHWEFLLKASWDADLHEHCFAPPPISSCDRPGMVLHPPADTCIGNQFYAEKLQNTEHRCGDPQCCSCALTAKEINSPPMTEYLSRGAERQIRGNKFWLSIWVW